MISYYTSFVPQGKNATYWHYALDIKLETVHTLKMEMITKVADLPIFSELRLMGARQLIYQVLNFGMIIATALMIWKGMMVVTGSESPVVVVLSGSMEPSFYRGDLLILGDNHNQEITAGEIVVFRIKGRDIPVVHRVIRAFVETPKESHFLTKGDNNRIDDRGLYAEGQNYVHRSEIIGRARGLIPYIGMVTILLNDYPQLKYVVIGVLAILVLIHRE